LTEGTEGGGQFVARLDWVDVVAQQGFDEQVRFLGEQVIIPMRSRNDHDDA